MCYYTDYDPTDYDYSPMCRHCEENEQKLDHAKEWLESVVRQLYSKDKLDCLELENDLDELCHLLGVRMIPGDLTIARKSDYTPRKEIIQFAANMAEDHAKLLQQTM